jgi:HAD superfamily hydrolase (TIGR01490 family)
VAIAFFDLDRTLIAANSGVLWLKSELRLGRISRLQAALASLWVARYHLGFVGMEHGIRRAIGSLAGSAEGELQERTTAFYESEVRSLVRPGARRALEAHRLAGDKLVLLTSSSRYMSELVARDLLLDEVLCNHFEVDPHGNYTGKPQGQLCFGPGKLTHAEACAQKLGADLSQCAFYTDSYSDLPVLAVVGRPVAVNPDFRLRRAALQRGWEVVDWGMPEPSGVQLVGAPARAGGGGLEPPLS